jgi:nucleotide-binding universal stress UspA family protein
MAAAAGVDFQIEVRAGHAAEVITRYAREVEADLVVVGHGGRVLNDYLLGSTADRVAHHAHRPVMIVM